LRVENWKNFSCLGKGLGQTLAIPFAYRPAVTCICCKLSVSKSLSNTIVFNNLQQG
jgi:hypothetical protein